MSFLIVGVTIVTPTIKRKMYLCRTIQKSTKMKTLIGILFVAVLAFSCSSNSNQPVQAAANTVAVVNKTINLGIDGMTCTGCENTIKEAVGKVAGVSEVTASHTDGLAVIKYDSTITNIKTISDAITEAGYTVTGEKNTPSTPPSSN
jgi:copper chaperone CopZ